MKENDLTPIIVNYLDSHLSLHLVEFLKGTKIYDTSAVEESLNEIKQTTRLENKKNEEEMKKYNNL
jgi:hypothetical protein